MEYRSIDGSGNLLAASATNASNTAFVRTTAPNFADDARDLIDGPNPRVISNTVVGEGDAEAANPQGLSGMMYAWGQFIDHDITLTADSRNRSEPISIRVPDGDPHYAPGTIIPMTRAQVDANGDPINAVTGWLDASMVYGSTEEVAAKLRGADGTMRTSAGNNLPIAEIDPTGEDTSNTGALRGHLAGDGRADENPSLTALQTLFVREHNYQVERLHEADQRLTGDELYEQARAIVTAEIAHITYTEFLPHLLGELMIPEYRGYDAGVDPRLSIEFAGAAYRWGHSTVSPRTEKLSEAGEPAGESSLADAFFQNPETFAADGGADGLLRHLASDLSQTMDVRIVDDLRNFLFDPPVGLDLAAINIQRGRELGLPLLNDMRAYLGLERHTDFDDITSDAETVAAMRATYASVDQVDLWTGGLAEEVETGFIGETFGHIIADQFARLRDGDRLWYENQGFDEATLTAIKETSLSDLILRNTDTEVLQADVFTFYERRLADAEPTEPDYPQLVIEPDALGMI
jgi:peroxidase